MRLSILICHLENRKDSLDALLECLDEQTLFPEEIEIFVETDGGKMTTGTKRNILLEKASGEYVAFIDDDDLVTADYVSSILKAVETGPDVIGIIGKMYCTNGKDGTFTHSIQHRDWVNKEGGIYLRPPNHLNPVRREYALATRFPDKSFSEDQDYSMRLLPLLKTEVMVDHPIYLYYAR